METPVNNLAEITAELERARAARIEAKASGDKEKLEAATAEVRRLFDAQVEAEKAAKAQQQAQQQSTHAGSLGFLSLPDRLPFSGLPGYLLGVSGAPYRVKGRGRKEGAVGLEKRTYGAKRIVRYRLSVNGEQKDFSMRSLALARQQAEEEYRQAGARGQK